MIRVSEPTAERLALDNEILRVQVGSGVHGANIAGQDDDDEMGICVEPPDYVIGLRHFEQWIYRTQPDGERSGPGDLDLTIYSLRKWMRLALQGNPTILLPLFTPPEAVRRHTPLGEDIFTLTDRIVSQQAGRKFLGYMQSQRLQLLGLKGKKHTNRPELVERYGFDTKFAYHMIRLGLQGIELLSTGRITLPIPQPDLGWLRGLRVGAYTREEALELSHELEDQLRLAIASSPLREYPDYEFVNAWLITTHQQHWSGNSKRWAFSD